MADLETPTALPLWAKITLNVVGMIVSAVGGAYGYKFVYNYCDGMPVQQSTMQKTPAGTE